MLYKKRTLTPQQTPPGASDKHTHKTTLSSGEFTDKTEDKRQEDKKTNTTPTLHQTTILGTYIEKMHQEPMRGLVREKIHTIEAREN